MKKDLSRKLSLNRETVRNLQSETLSQVQGGAWSQWCTRQVSCYSEYECTVTMPTYNCSVDC